MRLLHIHSGNLYGGVETMLITLARYRHLCPALEMQVALCFEGRLSEELEAAGLPVYRLGNVRTSRPLSVWQARRKLQKVLEPNRFDVTLCHSTWTQAIFGPVVRAAQLPLIFWLHGEANGKHWLEHWAKLTRPDLAICNSQFTARTIDRLYPGIKAAVLYCPVAAPEVSLTSSERRAIRAELETPEEAIVIVQVSRMEECKGQALHLQALSLLRDVPNWVCWQVGGAQRPQEQRYFAQLKLRAKQLGLTERVCFLGQRSDVPRLLAAADIHCQPNSGPDSFGLTFIEALMARLPVVTTALGGAREIVDDSCGCLVSPNDPQALATSLRQLIENPGRRAKLGIAGPARANQLCGVGKQLAEIKDLCSTVAQHKAACDAVQWKSDECD